MDDAVIDYLQKFVGLHKRFLHNEFHFLKQKNQSYHNNDFSQISSVIAQQQQDFSNLIPHLKAFHRHKYYIERELFGDELLYEQYQRFCDVTLREDFFVNFLLFERPSIEKILSSQQKALEKKDSRGVLSRIQQGFRRGTHSNLVDFLEREEEAYSWFLDQYVTKVNELQNQFNYQKTHRAYDKIKNYVLDASVGITSVPLGPLELASLPLWGVYISMKEFEELSHNFEHYRSVQKHRIVK